MVAVLYQPVVNLAPKLEQHLGQNYLEHLRLNHDHLMVATQVLLVVALVDGERSSPSETVDLVFVMEAVDAFLSWKDHLNQSNHEQHQHPVALLWIHNAVDQLVSAICDIYAPTFHLQNEEMQLVTFDLVTETNQLALMMDSKDSL